MCDMFLILKTTYFTDYAGNNTPFVVRDNMIDGVTDLMEIGEKLINGFWNNAMRLNTEKFHLFSNSQEPHTLKIGDLHRNDSVNNSLNPMYSASLASAFNFCNVFWQQGLASIFDAFVEF